MEWKPDYSIEEIAEASAAVKNAPGGMDEDALINELYLGAFAACLEAKLLPGAAQWTAQHQDAILLFRSTGQPFQEVLELAAGRMLRARWLDRYFHGVCPNEPDPRNANLELMGSLEELAMSGVIEVEFAVQVVRETEEAGREDLLARLAETSRGESLQTGSDN